jgi:hypothetical protein
MSNKVMEEIDSKSLKEASKSFGTDLIGIASIDRFADLPAEKNPLSIFPEAKSVIVILSYLPGSSGGTHSCASLTGSCGFLRRVNQFGN